MLLDQDGKKCIYNLMVDDDTILAVLFDDRSKTEEIMKGARECGCIIAKIMSGAREGRSSNRPSEPEEGPEGENFNEGAQERLDTVFGD